MCGIVGVLQYESEVSREIRHKALKILFSATMIETEARGEDATGIYQVHQDGDWMMGKKGVKSSKWLFEHDDDDPIDYQAFVDSWIDHPQEMTALVGHCRKATMGSRGRDNNDNHPFAIQLDEHHAILGIHNGTLLNHEMIFNKLPKMLTRQGQVDSEAIFHLLFHLSKHGTEPFDGEMIKLLGNRLDGAYACIAVNSRFPNTVATFREGRPMEYFLISPLNIILIASEKKFAEAALAQYELIREMGIDKELPRLTFHNSTLIDKDWRVFDTSVAFPTGTLEWKSIDEVSEKGVIKKFHDPVEKGWAKPVAATTSKGTAGAGTRAVGTGTGTGANAAASSGSSNAGSHKRAVPRTGTASVQSHSKVGDDDKIKVVEVEVEGRNEEAYTKAKSLGVCTTYKCPKDVAEELGIPAAKLTNMTIDQIADIVAQHHFSLGYAVATHDAEGKVSGVRELGKEQSRKMEHLTAKQLAAQDQIWARNQIITVILSLARGKYKINLENIGRGLSCFRDRDPERTERVLTVADAILTDPSVIKSVGSLIEAYEEAKEKDSESTRAASSEAHGND